MNTLLACDMQFNNVVYDSWRDAFKQAEMVYS
jgi:hypothetical protein